MNDILNNILKLSCDIINLIKNFICIKYITFTNRENYNLFHIHIKKYIHNSNNYILDTIKRDNDFVFNLIVRENYMKWYENNQYIYKNMIFKNKIYFIIYYCIENQSINCKNIVNLFLKEHGLNKNLHKKNIVKYIKWTN